MATGEKVKGKRFEVDPALMKKVKQQYITEEEIDKIIEMRREYLDWMLDNFAQKLIKPPRTSKTEA
jgi:uncharacterized protein YnzC (UPF0291/DUF896 family)